MKILLLGCYGQVGWELQRSLAPLGELYALGRNSTAPLNGDLLDLQALAKTVRGTRPDVIVNAAAYTAVDKAEVDQDVARAVNTAAPKLLADEARRIKCWLVHYSTDYVFDGSCNRPWKETDLACPLNAYGATKLDGEEAIRASGCNHLIFRTSWVYAARSRNFISTMLRLAQQGKELRVINDQVGAPTGAELIADVTAHVLPSTLNDAQRAGTYHLSASGETTWFEYARFIIERARISGWSIDPTLPILPVSSEEFCARALRPKNSLLDCHKLVQTYGTYLPDWRVGVKRALAEARDWL